MRLRKLPIISTILIAGLGMALLSSYSMGISGYSSTGCGGAGCHGAQSAGTVISLSGIPPTGWVPNTTYPLTLTVTNTAKVAAGFDMLANIGSFTAVTGTALSSPVEIRHNTPRSFVGGTTTWTFNWTAPASGATAFTINVACNAVNLNGTNDVNDNWNTATYTYNSSATTTAPTVTTTAATAITANSATGNGTVNANGATTTVTIEYGTTITYGSTAAATPGSVTGSTVTNITGSITALQPNTTYHYRIVATNVVGVTNGNDMTFTTNAIVPVVTTTAATAITPTTASANGLVNANNAPTTVTVEYGLTTAYGSTASANPNVVTGNTATSVSAPLSGLIPNTLYHYRVVGVNSAGTVNGADLTFTTAIVPTAPLAITDAASGVTAIGANLNGTVNPNNAPTAVSFEYGTTTTYGTTVTANPASLSGNTTSSVNAPITGLTANTTYHYRVVATNSVATTNGADMTFTTTAPAVPTVVTTAATGISGTTATLNGNVTANGDNATITIEYGTTTAYGNIVAATPGVVSATSIAELVSATVNSLAANTVYHYRVNATNVAGTTHGADMTFTTLVLPTPPRLTITNATDINGNGATINGTVNSNNQNATVIFEYGTTPAFGSTIDADPALVNSNTATPVSATITGLLAFTRYYYRIKAVSSVGTAFSPNGSFVTGSLSIGSLSEGGFSVYPNPAKDMLILTTKNDAEDITLYAASISGSTVALPYKKISADQYQISTRDLATGNYLLLLKSGDKFYTTQFIKQ